VKVVDAIARILKIEGAEFLSAYPTTPVIEAAARAEIRPVLCRQERVGVGIADGYARVTNGKKLAAFCMQYGPGAENAFPGVATAYSDSTPMLLLPLGHPRDRAQVFPLFSSARTFASVTKGVETITQGSQVGEVMRRAISLMRMGRPGPTMVEIPADVVNEEVPDALVDAYRPPTRATSRRPPACCATRGGPSSTPARACSMRRRRRSSASWPSCSRRR
jgi:acetolactate synthase-1/2/3 large subunit